jgi:hypothetical protein
MKINLNTNSVYNGNVFKKTNFGTNGYAMGYAPYTIKEDTIEFKINQHFDFELADLNNRAEFIKETPEQYEDKRRKIEAQRIYYLENPSEFPHED